jgi:hypothetical protein
MSSWAEIGENNVVIRVTVGNNDEPDEGYSWLIGNLGGHWVKTSYNTFGGVHYTTDEEGNRVPSEDQTKALRFNYAGIGFTYDEDRDAFIPPKPFESWVLNNYTCLWEAPEPYPTDGESYTWNEATEAWEQINNG